MINEYGEDLMDNFEHAIYLSQWHFDMAIRAKTVTKDMAQYARSKAAFIRELSNAIGFASI